MELARAIVDRVAGQFVVKLPGKVEAAVKMVVEEIPGFLVSAKVFVFVEGGGSEGVEEGGEGGGGVHCGRGWEGDFCIDGLWGRACL